MVVGDTDKKSNSEIISDFKEHVKSHLFIDDTVVEAGTFIFYDVVFPSLESNIKSCQVIMYLICHRSILENYHRDGYYGNRVDILSQMIENALINDKDTVNNFGIGELNLTKVDVYNSTRFYGCVMIFNVPSFR